MTQASVAPDLALLFRTHASFVARVLRRFGVPELEVEDALQEVFIVVSAELTSYQERGALRAWLFTIARQVASHARRAHGRRAARDQQAAELTSPPPSTPEEQLRGRQAVLLLHKFMATLPEEQATAFYLSEVEGFSAVEIAACDASNLNTVYARVRLARKRFAEFVRKVNAEGRTHGGL